MTDIEYLNKSIKEKIVERVKNGFFDGAGGYLKAMDYYAKGLISLDTVKGIELEIAEWENQKLAEEEQKSEVEETIEETTDEEITEEPIVDETGESPEESTEQTEVAKEPAESTE